MKILVHGKVGNLYGGFQPQAEKAGHQWIWWEEAHTPAFDAFETVKPDLFIGDKEQSRAVMKCLAHYHVKPIFQFGNEFCFGLDKETVCRYPLLIDTVNYYPECPGLPEFACNLACCEEPNDAVIASCIEIYHANIKIFSPVRWPVMQYLGNINNANKLRLYRSARWVFANTAVELSRSIGAGTPCITCNKKLWEGIEQHALFIDNETNPTKGYCDLMGFISVYGDKDTEMYNSNKKLVLESQQYVLTDMKLTYERAWADLMELI